MRSFRDASGREWELVINVASARRVRDKTGVLLYGLIDDGAKPLEKLLADPITLTEVVYHLCRQSSEVSEEQFCEQFVGDTLLAASEAFMEELIDFFQDPRARAALRRLTAKSLEFRDAILERAQREIELIDPRSMAESWNSSSGASPASLDSTPDPSLSES